MTANVLAILYGYIDRLSEQDLWALDDEHIDWLPRLGVMPGAAAQELRNVLEGPYNVLQCLERIAWLMCWLVQRRKVRPWLLYRFGASFLRADYAAVIQVVASIIPRRGYHMTIQARHQAGTYYVCMINGDPYPAALGHVVICLVFWHGYPFAAAYVGRVRHQRELADALHEALDGETVELLEGLHADLDSAFRMGCRNLCNTVIYRRISFPPLREPLSTCFLPQQHYPNVPGGHHGGVP
nr:uncharacterized protein LOC129388261 [Dermacentor andersoni]